MSFWLVPTLQRGNAVWPLQRSKGFMTLGRPDLPPTLERGSQRDLWGYLSMSSVFQYCYYPGDGGVSDGGQS